MFYSVTSPGTRYRDQTTASLGASVLAETGEAALGLVRRDHAAALGRVDRLQHGHNLRHLRPLVRVRVPATLHHVR